jgi:hypothetical protein
MQPNADQLYAQTEQAVTAGRAQYNATRSHHIPAS